MQVLLALTGLLALSAAFNPLTDDVIDYINNVAKPGWTAGRNFHEHELPLLKALACVNVTANGEYMRLNMPEKDMSIRRGLPETFDAREKWSKCASLREIRDQGRCGSCWAFATAEAITDRMCINGLDSVRISSEDILSCCDWCGKGCGGGFPAKAWQFYCQSGVVTGGPYASNQGCMPYEIAPAPANSLVYMSDDPTPPCRNKCRKGYDKTYPEDKHKGKNSYAVTGVKKIMQEIVDHGPVTAVFELYQDFFTYKSGVYRHTTGFPVGGHVVKLLGFGTEKGDDYWLAANSWNSTFGENGFFKILRGSNECGIEDWIAGGVPAS